MKFDNKIVVVAGGASGIGEACATFFATRGASVVVADRNVDAAGIVARRLGGNAVTLDVGDENNVEKAATEIEARFGTPDILVNSAGVLQRPLPPGELGIKEWDFVTRIDLRGTYLCCAAFGTRMSRQGRGAIVNIASVAGMRSGPLHGYGPAKAGVINLTECLAAEWGPSGVRVNSVSPGFTATPALEKSFETNTLSSITLSESSVLGRLVKPDEIASSVAFLASDLASAITGVNLVVDAGYLVATPWASYGGLRKNFYGSSE
jgi:NAD(P)-dependent dehydrogenase (short-subunit alcohol dehydrogenase family)